MKPWALLGPVSFRTTELTRPDSPTNSPRRIFALGITITASDPALREFSTINIHNIYNEPTTNLALALTDFTTLLQNSATEEHIIVGDLNIHHPSWGGTEVTADTRAESLLQIMDTYNLQQNVPTGTITYEGFDGSCSSIDLSFTTPNLSNKILTCERMDELYHDSTHWPIETTFEITIELEPPEQRTKRF